MQKKRVVVGLSGGVDSAVTAKILLDQGYDVIGIFMKNWEDKDDPHCPAAVDAIDARNVAQTLGIPFYTVNFSQVYWDSVFDYFLQEHQKLRTPNPDILCNKYIKFAAFLEHAKSFDADFMATGHYAKNYFNPKTQKYELQVAFDQNKDQTYFLYTLNQEALAQTLFPLSDLPKPEIRKMAEIAGFKNAKKKDSTGICFVGERDYMEFLQKYLAKEPGDILTEKGEIVGQHIGLSFYTLGQRKNLSIGGIKGYEEKPWFVLEKISDKNQLIVAQDNEHPKLLNKTCFAPKLHWISETPPMNGGEKFVCLAKIRYRQHSQKCEIFWDEDQKRYEIHFETAQRAITPGQSIVFYDLEDKICLGGGEVDL